MVALEKEKRLMLPEKLERALLAGHPWLYREQIPKGFTAPLGGWVKVVCGKFEGYGLWDPDGALAVRIFSRTQRPDANWFQTRIREAWELRQEVHGDGTTNAFRWVFGEADSLPGVVVDFYAGYAVVVCDSVATLQLLKPLSKALNQTTPLKGVVLRRRPNQLQGTEKRVEHLSGRLPPEDLIIVENRLRLRANVFSGQKTGLFLDQRENRRYVEQQCAGKRVLNLFSYSGAFSLYAARGGATKVVSVDIAPDAAADAAANFELNGFDASAHEFVVQDVFEFLEEARQRARFFDVVICDPPSFARNQSQVRKALNAYERVNAAGMKVVSPNGLYAAASCTSRISEAALLETLASAARRARRRFQITASFGHAPDHPVLAGHPEGRYLKFLMGRLRELA